MKKNAIKNVGLGFVFLVALVFSITHDAKASELTYSYHTTATSAKVMDGISDVIITTSDRKAKAQEKFILQCDTTTESVNIFYWMHDSEGTKLTGAEGMTILAYNQNDTQTKANAAVLYDSSSDKASIREALDLVNKMDPDGTFVLQFWKWNKTFDQEVVGNSMMIPRDVAQVILDKLEGVDPLNDCDIHSEFSSTYSLKNFN